MYNTEYYTNFSWASDTEDDDPVKSKREEESSEDDDGFTTVVNKRKNRKQKRGGLKRQTQFHFKDELLVCENGNHQFILTVEEQLEYISKNKSLPKNCNKC